jgi:hypothetical protein
MEQSASPRGRVYWEQIHAEWKASGLTQPAFCRERNILYSTFAYWRTQLKEKNNLKNKTESIPFAEIKMNSVKPIGVFQSEIKIRFPNGVMVIVDKYVDIKQLQDILGLIKEFA